MKKRVLALILTGMMAVSLAGCGGAKEPVSDGGTLEEEAKAPTEEASGEEEGKTPASDQGDGFVVGFSNGYWGNTWRAQMIEDFEKQAEKYKTEGILSDYMVSNTNSDAAEQLNQINAMIDAGVDAIMIDAVSPTTIRSAVERAKKEGILVVITNDPAAYEGTICVCGDNYSWQQIQARWLA